MDNIVLIIIKMLNLFCIGYNVCYKENKFKESDIVNNKWCFFYIIFLVNF